MYWNENYQTKLYIKVMHKFYALYTSANLTGFVTIRQTSELILTAYTSLSISVASRVAINIERHKMKTHVHAFTN
jgi:hypothetical protein